MQNHDFEIEQLAVEFQNRLLAEIEARKKTEASLRQSEENYRLLTELSPDPVLVHDQKGKVLFANAACLEITAAPDIESLIGRNVLEFIVADATDLVKGELKDYIECGKSYQSVAYKLRRLDGIVFDAEISAAPIHFNELPSVLIVIQNVSERNKADLFAKHTTEILEMIATGQAASGIYDAIAQMYEARHPGMRCSMLALKGDTLLHCGAPSLPAAYCLAVNGLKNGPDIGSCGSSSYTGKRVLVEDIATDPKWVELNSVALSFGLRSCWSEPVKDIAGKVIGAFGMYYNHPSLPNEQESLDLASAAKIAGIVMERDLRESHVHMLSEAIEQAGESILITDKAGIIEYVNPAFTALTGYTAEEAIGQTPKMLKSGNQDAAFYKNMWKTITSGKVWQGKVIDRKKDGSFYPATLVISPVMNQAGEYNNFIGIQSDLTEIEGLEHQFYQAQKMEAIGTLVGGIAHDFNNILASMRGNLFMAKQRTQDMPAVLKNLTNVETLSFRAADMIQQLLAFARKSAVKMKPVPFTQFIKETVKLLHVSVPEDISVCQDVCNDMLQIEGDTTLLHQVLMNLINNARDAVEAELEPAITIKLETFKPDDDFIQHHTYFTDGVYAHLSVADNGCGIPESQFKHLFEPFYTTKEVGKGTGLGLAMVFGAIKTHHGFIEVESIEGAGSVFHIYLPLLISAMKVDAAGSEKNIVEGQGQLILLADDDQDIVETGKEVLEALGYRVLIANDGRQAVDMFEAHSGSIDLCILDVVMPVMSGDKAAKCIRAMNQTVKVVFTTGYDGKQLSSMSDETVLSKPFSIEALSRVIKTQLNTV